MSNPLRSSLAFLLVAVVGCAHIEAAEGDDVSRSACFRVAFEQPPVWSFDGTWTEDSDTLILTDPGAGVLRLYDDQGRGLRVVAHPGQGPLDLRRPSGVWPLEDGYLLKDEMRFLWLDAELEPRRSYDPETVPVAPRGTVRAVYDWVASAGAIFGFGAVLLPDDSWWTGFLWVAPEDATNHRLLLEIPVDDRQVYDHYFMGYQHVAVLGEAGYFLVLKEPPHLVEAHPGREVRRLRSFPEGFDSLPALPLNRGAAYVEIRHRAYESVRLPVGLYARGNRLYVLTREPIKEGEGGGTRWMLTRIDPESDRVEGSVVLPTQAAHLAVIPGPSQWAVLEKGRLEALGVQPIPSLLLVPSSWIESADSPLADEGPKEGLCDGP